MRANFMSATLPNLELLQYIATEILLKEENIAKKIEEKYKMPVKWVIDLEANVFLQTWGNTCTAFDVDKDGNAVLGGQAMTSAYTVVFLERHTQTYVVFVDNKFCYYVTNATDEFLLDLTKHNLKSLSEAKKFY